MVLVEDGGNDARYLVFKLVVEPFPWVGEFLGWSQVESGRRGRAGKKGRMPGASRCNR